MKILAILQNQWLRNAEFHQRVADDFLARHGVERWWKRRERILPFTLFRGCKTGRVLRAHLGGALCDRIIWEETTTRLSADPSEILPIEPEHVAAVFERYKPDALIAFGNIASTAIRAIEGQVDCQKVFRAPHPAVRDKYHLGLLTEVCGRLKDAYQV